jgi:hypothetical protein
MDGSLANLAVVFVVTASPLVVLGTIMWQWQKELHHELRLRRRQSLSLRNNHSGVSSWGRAGAPQSASSGDCHPRSLKAENGQTVLRSGRLNDTASSEG